MNSVDSRLYSMTRSTGVKEPLQHPHWSVVDGVSSLLPTKKPFHITRIVRRTSESEDGMNDEDETVALNISNSEADVMSISEEKCKTAVADHHLPLANILNKDIKHSEEDGVQSRFRIVKIESKGLIRRGRWACRDFADPPEAKANDVAETEFAGSSSAAEPVFYVQGAGPAASQLIFYSEGQPFLESDTLPCASKLLIGEIAGSFSTTEPGSVLQNMCRPSGDCLSEVSGLKSIDVANSDAETDGTVVAGFGDVRHNFDRVSWQAGHEEFGTSSLLSLVVDESNELSSASGSLSEIDNKIEQAMDLVKQHLMLAVRAEIEDLKEQIKQLTVKNQQLEYENGILRGGANPDLLASLDSTLPDLDYNNGS